LQKWGEIYKFGGNKGEYAMCITDTGGWIRWGWPLLAVNANFMQK